ncbi:hypothetical protein BDQ17DRAFT_1030821 [Cyathus striatus]|nr:hypothetical protein BDQ17DRAFT_1030821 [Cyathus striatus]
MMDSSAENRLSYEQIHEHWIFETIDWEAVEHQTVAPPFEEYYDILDDERAKRAQAIAPTPVLPPISLGPGIDSSSSSVF